MRRVNKGKLAGRPMASAEDLGLQGLDAQDAEGLSKATLGPLFDAAVYMDDEGLILACSPGLLGRAGTSVSDVVGKSFKDLGQGDEERARLSMALLDAKQKGGGVIDAKLKSSKARALPAKITLTAAMSGTRRRWLATMSLWVTEDNSEGQRGATVGHGDIDAATGLLGRSAFLQAAGRAYDRDGFKDRPCLIAIDLVSLGVINDKFGSEAGDMVIEGVAARLQEQRRRGDFAARLGSDRFCLYASFAGNLGDAQAICERLTSALEQPFEVRPGEIEMVGVRLGVALGPKDGAVISDLLLSAERAAKAAKKAGVGRSWAEGTS